MKKTALALSTLLSAAPSLLGFIELDRGGVTLQTEFQAVQDSNIRGNADKESDLYFSVNPTLQYQRRARGTIAATLGMDFLRFDKFSEYDSENLHGTFGYDFPLTQGSPLSGGLDFSYVESTGVDQFVNNRVASDTTSLSLSGQYRLRPRISIRGNAGYVDRAASFYSDTQEERASLGLVVDEVWQDVGVTLDFNHRKLKSSGDVGFQRNGTDDSLSVGLKGQILPKGLFNNLEAYASVSFQKVDSTITSGTGDSNIVGYDGSLSWTPRETTNISLSFSRSVQNTITDFSVKYSTINLGINQAFSRLVSGGLSLYQRKIEYFGLDRNETRIGASANLSTKLGRNWSAGLSVSWDDVDSPISIYNYGGNRIGLFSTYTF
jgi:hypothetical protein